MRVGEPHYLRVKSCDCLTGRSWGPGYATEIAPGVFRCPWCGRTQLGEPDSPATLLKRLRTDERRPEGVTGHPAPRSSVLVESVHGKRPFVDDGRRGPTPMHPRRPAESVESVASPESDAAD